MDFVMVVQSIEIEDDMGAWLVSISTPGEFQPHELFPLITPPGEFIVDADGLLFEYDCAASQSSACFPKLQRKASENDRCTDWNDGRCAFNSVE